MRVAHGCNDPCCFVFPGAVGKHLLLVVFVLRHKKSDFFVFVDLGQSALFVEDVLPLHSELTFR